MKFGEKLKKLRAEKGDSQATVAKGIGVNTRTYLGYEQEGRYPRKRSTYTALAEYFGVDTNYLLAEDEEFISESAAKYGYRGRREAETLVAELSGMFAGGELTEGEMEAVMIALQRAYFECKQDNKKYTPYKYR